MKSSKALRLFLFGLFFVAICINVETGIDTAFKLSEGSGLTGFVVYNVNEIINGNSFSIDIFFDPAGYVMMILGIKLLGDKIKHDKYIMTAFLIAMAMSIASMLIVVTISDGGLLIKLIVALYVLEGVALLLGINKFVAEIKAKVDSYYNMEVGKDLSFAVELFFFAYFTIILVVFLCAFDLFFADIVLYFEFIVMVYSAMYFIYKMDKYNKKLNILE